MEDKMKLFKTRLKETRISAGLSQVKLAEIIGVTKSVYNKYETGDVKPPIDKIIKIAMTLHVSIDYLVGLKDVAEIQGEKEQYKTQREQDLLKQYRSLSQQGQTVIDEHIHDLLLTGKYRRNLQEEQLFSNQTILFEKEQQDISQIEQNK